MNKLCHKNLSIELLEIRLSNETPYKFSVVEQLFGIMVMILFVRDDYYIKQLYISPCNILSGRRS